MEYLKYNGKQTSIDNIKAAIKAQKWDKSSYEYALSAMEPHRFWAGYSKAHLIEIFYEYITHKFRCIARFTTFALLEWEPIEGAVPVIEGDDLLVETAFYKWLQEKHESEPALVDAFLPAVKAYTGNIEAPFKNRTDGQAHKYAFQCFWSNLIRNHE